MTMRPADPAHQAADDEEAARLAALHGYGVLDTPPEPGYDDVVRIAAEVCGAPIALVTLLDADRQWFKARIGTEMTGSPRDVALCNHAIRQDEVLVVPDAAADARFRDNPLVLGDPHIRFYAGAPIFAPGGARLGTVCVLDPTPRAGLTEEQAATLRALARMVTAQLELRAGLAARNALLLEKDRLLHVVNHRVANSLQLVQTILSLQARASADPALRVQLGLAGDRVMSVAAAYRHLFHGDSVLDADMHGYLRGLLDELQDAAPDRPIALAAPALRLPADRLTALGIAVTELVGNARAHGAGQIQVSVAVQAGLLELAVEDEGPGFPADFDPATGRGVGMRLTRALSAGGMPVAIDRGVGHARIVVRIALAG